MSLKYLALDFDGTCVTHAGQDIGAVPVIKELSERYHIILWTVRSGEHLKEAEQWFENNLIRLYGVNENPDQNWSKSPKAYANIYIDDAGLGIPLKYDPALSPRAFVDWQQIKEWMKNGFL